MKSHSTQMNKFYSNITNIIQKENMRGINIDSRYPLSNLFLEKEFHIRSDTDEQCILHFPFRAAVSIKSITFHCRADDSQPTVVHLYINKPNITFSGIDDLIPQHTETVPIFDGHLESFTWSFNVKYSLFNQIEHLTVFIEENNGGEASSLISMQPKEVMNMKDLKKCGG